MTVLYPNQCYNEMCNEWTELYLGSLLSYFMSQLNWFRVVQINNWSCIMLGGL